ncbi:thermonuclease family protein [bacterium]|nr:thermonuclease family protein [bacterium]
MKKIKLIFNFLCLLVIFIGAFIFFRIYQDKLKIEREYEAAGFIKVQKVIDGDTIKLKNGEIVRYIGIDTPETVDPRRPIQCFGYQASKMNKKLVEGKYVRLEKDITERDKYGRLLRYVYLPDGTFVNLKLVEMGYAFSYTYPPDIKYQDLFIQAERKARENNLGLWKKCQPRKLKNGHWQSNAL